MKIVELEKESTMKNKFKRFGGEVIEDLGQYIRDYLKKFPGTSLYIGADSVEKGRQILYSTTVAFYDEFRRDGVHYIFSKELAPNQRMWVERTGNAALDKATVKAAKEANVYNKIYGEVERVLELGQYLEVELEGVIRRKTMDELIALDLSPHQNRLIDIDVDINPDPGYFIPEDLQGKVDIRNRKYFVDEKNDRLVNAANPRLTIPLDDLSVEELKYVIDVHVAQPAKLRAYLNTKSPKDVKNKSQFVYEVARAVLEGQGFRVRYKPNAWAATCAADFVCDTYRRSTSKKAKRRKAA
jgi:predicted RNase H-related nuclease YkuK (DUF458 family)